MKLSTEGDQDTRNEKWLNFSIPMRILLQRIFPNNAVGLKKKDTQKRKSIVIVSGSPDEYSPFSVGKKNLLSNDFHFLD